MSVTWLTYSWLRRQHPELKLPAWQALHPLDRRRAKHLSVEQLRVRRFSILLIREPGVVDRLRRIDPTKNQKDSFWSPGARPLDHERF